MTEQIQTLLKEALEKGFITVGEAEEAKSLMVGSDSADFDWTLLQPIIDKAQGIEPVDPIEDEERLRLRLLNAEGEGIRLHGHSGTD